MAARQGTWCAPGQYGARGCLRTKSCRKPYSFKNVRATAPHPRAKPGQGGDGTPSETPGTQALLRSGSNRRRLSLESLFNSIGCSVSCFTRNSSSAGLRAIACAARFFDLSFTTEDGLNTLRTDASLLHRNIVYVWDTLLDLEFLVRLGWNPVRRLNRSFRKRFRFLKFVRKKLFSNKQRDAS